MTRATKADADAILLAFLRGEQSTIGPYKITENVSLGEIGMCIAYDNIWAVGTRGGALVVWFDLSRPAERVLLGAVERLTGVSLLRVPTEGENLLSATVLGPLGLAALRASLTTTVVS